MTIESLVDESLNRRVVVASDYTIRTPLIGTTNVKGSTLEQLENHLNDRYSKFVKDPGIFVGRAKDSRPFEK